MLDPDDLLELLVSQEVLLLRIEALRAVRPLLRLDRIMTVEGAFCRLGRLLVIIIVNGDRSGVFADAELALPTAQVLFLDDSYLVLAFLQECYVVFHETEKFVLVLDLV